MVRAKFVAALNGFRTAVEGSRKAVVALGALLIVEVGGRIGLPGLNTQVLSDYFLHRGGAGIFSLYNWIVGGALTRGAVLALGIMPYLSARIYVGLAKWRFRAVAAMEENEAGRIKLRRITRLVTVSLAVVQSAGFTWFVQAIPGAVTRPGAGFVVQTMLTLTAGAIVAMVLAEQVTAHLARDTEDDAPISESETEIRVEGVGAGSTMPLLPSGPLDAALEIPRQRETVIVPRSS